MTIHGKNLIGRGLSGLGVAALSAMNPATGSPLPESFHPATPEELARAAELARGAAAPYAALAPERRAAFLEAIATELEALGAELVARVTAETALPEARILSERGRTTAQLRMFAQLVREGSWVDAVIDTGDPERKPLPKPDVRRMLRPLGPVAVFGASNFPVAFSTAGGDTASALAAGNPVIVKAHEGHPGVSELAAMAVVKAARDTNMPEGVFAMLHGGPEVGLRLVRHPAIKAVGFTGSARAGRALMDAVAGRPDPIPVFAEMGSVNPVLLTPGALAVRGAELAAQLAGSVTVGCGQFCTNPGLLLGLAGPELDEFAEALGREIAAAAPGPMLNAGVHKGYEAARATALSMNGVTVLGQSAEASGPFEGRATVAVVAGSAFLGHPVLQHEVFGPYSLLVRCADRAELLAVVRALEGQLSATLMAEPEELADLAEVASALAERSGRMIFNGVPTGIEVCNAMHHGGPWPAASDARFTAVGPAAIRRFARPVAYQNWPENDLPPELQGMNPRGILRTVDGESTCKATGNAR